MDFHTDDVFHVDDEFKLEMVAIDIKTLEVTPLHDLTGALAGKIVVPRPFVGPALQHLRRTFHAANTPAGP